MATDAANIATIKSNTLSLLAELSATPKLSYTENGRTFDWTEYQAMLQKRVDWCNAQLGSEEPFVIETFICE